MKAIIVYESFWGNTAAVARAIAEGLGPGARAVSTAEARDAALAGVDLIVAGAPLVTFRVPSDKIIEMIRQGADKRKKAPDLTPPSMRSWYESLPRGSGRAAAFETRLWWSPGSAKRAILRGLVKAGYAPLAKPRGFVVKGQYGPLRDGELEKARLWGAELARSLG
jgi:hypothetical protein